MEHVNPRQVILSYGLGVDSTAILLRWIREPETRPCKLDDLVVITAAVGNEYPQTADLVNAHIVPLLREHGIRFVQVARGGSASTRPTKNGAPWDGIRVIDDSRAPERWHPEGWWKLSDELEIAGTVPQAAGCHKCAIKWKADVIGPWIEQNITRDYVQVIGYNADEPNRVAKSREYAARGADITYPLLDWGWTYADCERYIEEALGVAWVKSCCTFCPFSAGAEHSLRRYREEPAIAAQPLAMEYGSLALNPRQTLYATKSLRSVLAEDGQHGPLEAADAALSAVPFQVVHVRRWFRKVGQGGSRRSVRRILTGSRADCEAYVISLAAIDGLDLDTADGVSRAVVRRIDRDRLLAQPSFEPGNALGKKGADRKGRVPLEEGDFETEEYIVAAPAIIAEKEGSGFRAVWARETGEDIGPASEEALTRASEIKGRREGRCPQQVKEVA